jgi:hypothetical protein
LEILLQLDVAWNVKGGLLDAGIGFVQFPRSIDRYIGL